MNFGGHVTVNGQVRGSVIVIGGVLEVSGSVRGDVVAIGSRASLRDGAKVGGEVVNVGGSLKRGERVTINGQFTSVDFFDFGRFASGRGAFAYFVYMLFWAALIVTAVRFLGVLVVAAIAPQRIEGALAEPRPSWILAFLLGFVVRGLAGILIFILILPCVTIPVAVALWIISRILIWMGIASISLHIGRRVGRTVFNTDLSYFGAILTGFLIYAVVSFIPIFGFFVSADDLVHGPGPDAPDPVRGEEADEAGHPDRPAGRRGGGTQRIVLRISMIAVFDRCYGDVVDRDVADDAVPVDDDGRPVRDPLVLEVEPVLLRDGPLRLEVGQERVLDAELLGERLVGPDRVHADAEHGRAQRLELLQVVHEAGVLLRADGAEIERVEREDHLLALQRRQRVLLVVVSPEREVRGLFAHLDRHERNPPGAAAVVSDGLPSGEKRHSTDAARDGQTAQEASRTLGTRRTMPPGHVPGPAQFL